MVPSTSSLRHTHVPFFTYHHKNSLSNTSGPFVFQLHRHPNSLSSSQSLSSPSSGQSLQLTHVSTAPVEYAPPAPEFNFRQEIARLRNLKSKLSNAQTLELRDRVLDADSRVSGFFNSSFRGFARVLELAGLDLYEMYLVKCVIAAGQEHVISYGMERMMHRGFEFETRSVLKTAFYSLVEMIESWDVVDVGASSNVKVGERELMAEEVVNLRKLLKILKEMESFYNCIGGIIGYQKTVLELLAESVSGHNINSTQHMKDSMKCQFVEIHPPKGLDLSENTEYASQAALWGIEELPFLGEIYPLGGSADRLGLVDSDTGECLPAAMLPYCGRTLLEGLIRDLQAREFLYFKLYGKQCITPVAIMTSAAKNNHERISSLCQKHNWFGRGRSKFQLFEQPLVPAVSARDGEWLVSEPFMPVCKPGGHGVIWRLAYDKGLFQWFYNHGRKGATVRQVSNVVAATDVTLLALAGIGLHHGKKLGFASCQRSSGATEGINVLIEKKEITGKWAYGFSCIEYTEFDKFGLIGATSSKSLLAEFPANTNILYVDLPSVEQIASRNDDTCLPGLVLNTKKQVEYVDHLGIRHSISGGRLESTMQNIADNFSNTYASRHYAVKEDVLDTFVVYNERRRVTSSAKKKRKHGSKSLQQTPDGSLLDIMRNAYDLLSHCNIKIPEVGDNEQYIESGPPYLILLHPALGPLWEVARQKFHGGSISMGSELQIDVAEFFWRDVQLDGSMFIVAENVMGSMRTNGSGEPILEYGHRCARCKLQNVQVLNKGIDWESGDNIYWKHEVRRCEALKVLLHGNAEFEATDVTLEGNHVFEVPDGYRLKITSGNPGDRSGDYAVTMNTAVRSYFRYQNNGSNSYRSWLDTRSIKLKPLLIPWASFAPLRDPTNIKSQFELCLVAVFFCFLSFSSKLKAVASAYVRKAMKIPPMHEFFLSALFHESSLDTNSICILLKLPSGHSWMAFFTSDTRAEQNNPEMSLLF